MMLSKLIRSAPHDMHVIEIVGRMDGEHAARLSEIANTASTNGRSHLLLDLHAVEYINSSGLRTLVQLYKQITQRGGELIVINPTENIQRLFALVGLDTVFTIHHDARWTASALNGSDAASVSREICYCL